MRACLREAIKIRNQHLMHVVNRLMALVGLSSWFREETLMLSADRKHSALLIAINFLLANLTRSN